ncbi:DNA repair protein RAD51 homolog 2 [Trichonephila inaurata madagascariensis]|uniref:DNA repair protein RAD51 homolog 2 n=1 Tax=Trichonephila inaurata madagascariensis TaxID=2747483 RepID=A0A8X6IF99_9ARAC|nr:DNA repair protein RAD51 homolog 2 [Trichonephila inaurata madagascariensis]
MGVCCWSSGVFKVSDHRAEEKLLTGSDRLTGWWLKIGQPRPLCKPQWIEFPALDVDHVHFDVAVLLPFVSQIRWNPENDDFSLNVQRLEWNNDRKFESRYPTPPPDLSRMGSYKIRRLQLPQNVTEILKKNNLNSCKDVLSLTKLELQTLLGLSRSKAYDVIKNQEHTSVNTFLPLSLHSLDLLLQGGLLFGSITEFTGPPGVGKTQFCFMLSILTSLPVPLGLAAQVIYIDTESAFCAERLKIMAQKRFPGVIKEEVVQYLQRILVHKVNSITALKEVMLHLEKEIIKNKVKLIIIDSVASLMRKEFGTDGIDSLMERNKILMELAAMLKNLAQTYNLVVFLSNQIASHLVEPNSVPPDDSPDDEEGGITGMYTDLDDVPRPVASVPKKQKLQSVNTDHVIPALGNTWSHCVNTRLVAQFLNSSVRQVTILPIPCSRCSA